jgi:hypothetical protein
LRDADGKPSRHLRHWPATLRARASRCNLP